MSKLSTEPSSLTPKAALSVKGEIAPSVSLTFAKKLQDTKFSFTVTDQTLRQPSEFTGYVVSATRTDGPVTTTISHDFGKNLPKVRVVGNHKRDGNAYTLDYTHFPTKGGGAGVLEAIAKVGPEHKVALAHKLETSQSQLTYTLDKGEYAGSAAIDSRGAGLLTATRRVDGQSYKLGLIAAGPKSSGSFEWVNKPFKVVVNAPVSAEGLGVATTSLIYERTIEL